MHLAHWCLRVMLFYTNQAILRNTIGLYRENAIAIESEARYPNCRNVYYVTMQITFHIPEFAYKEHHLHCDVVHITTVCVSIRHLSRRLDGCDRIIQCMSQPKLRF